MKKSNGQLAHFADIFHFATDIDCDVLSATVNSIFTNPSGRAGYDTRSIFFKRSLTGLSSEFSFS